MANSGGFLFRRALTLVVELLILCAVFSGHWQEGGALFGGVAAALSAGDGSSAESTSTISAPSPPWSNENKPPLPAHHAYGTNESGVPDSQRSVATFASQSSAVCCNRSHTSSDPDKQVDCRIPIPLTSWVSGDRTHGYDEFVLGGRGGQSWTKDVYVTFSAAKDTTFARYFVTTQDAHYEFSFGDPFLYYGPLSQNSFTQCGFSAGYIEDDQWALRLVVQWYDNSGDGVYVLAIGNGAQMNTGFWMSFVTTVALSGLLVLL